ncbi:UNVERIFIED_CONTAM: hypothetical protein FKN15_058076 [Acipenser sinensis]
MASVDKGKATKEQKYDRQLRLWGDHGQDALENAHVCLINASATGTEILKNLVLPGIGAFTIVDDHKVRGEDVGNNFFLTKSSIGRNRAQAATELLQELNSDVSGNFVEESPEQLLDNDPDFFHRFSLVIAAHLPESTLLRLAAFVWGAGVPLLVCRTYGLIGYMRLVVKEHTVVESHPDNALEDLRLDHPFPELKKHIQSYDLENMEKRDHSHTPWIIVMAKYLEKWRSKISSGAEELLQDENSKNIKAQTSSFWLLVRALKEFVEKEGQGSLPVRGTIPDMIADSDKFIKLQNVYREKAKEDATAVSNHISALLQSVGRLPESVSEQEIRLFCKSSAFLRVVRCRSLAEEYSTETINKDEISSCMDNPDSEMVLYLMLRAVDKFYQQHGRYPGVYDYQVEEDIGKLKSCVNSFLQENGLAVNVKHDYIHEFCRYGAVEPHPVASFVGAMKTDLNLLLECLKYQMDSPASQKQALVTICSICQQNGDISDYFREIGGLLFVYNLAQSNQHSEVKETALFTLGALAESSENGQSLVKTTGCIDILLDLLRTSFPFSDENGTNENITQGYQLWSSLSSALCACVNNPQNEENQRICTAAFPFLKEWLQKCVRKEITQPICSFVGQTVANNSYSQDCFATVYGLDTLAQVFVKLVDESSRNTLSGELAVVVTKTLCACIADNDDMAVCSEILDHEINNILNTPASSVIQKAFRCSVQECREDDVMLIGG